MLMIRMQRTGRKHEPTFRLVLTVSKNGPKSGKFLKILGSYDPRHKESIIVKGDKIKEWMSKGAKLSDTVNNLLINNKVITGKKINVLPRKSPIKKEEVAPEVKTEVKAEVKKDEVVAEAKKEEVAPEVKVEVKTEASKSEVQAAEETPTEKNVKDVKSE